MKPPAFRYQRPRELEEALALLAEHGDEARPLAGGQSLVPMLNLRLAAPAVVVDLNRLPGLDGITPVDGSLSVGALVRQRALERSPLARRLGVLADGLPLVGHVATRNRGTVGGSLAHADPAAELPLALVALGGRVVAARVDGRRREIPAEEFYRGFLASALEPDELLVETRLPVHEPGVRGVPAGDDQGSALVEVAQRHGDFALAAAACWLRVAGGRVADARVAVGAVADRPLLVPEAGGALAGTAAGDKGAARAAGEAAAGAVQPAGSMHAPPAYQRHLIGVLVARAVCRAAARAGEGAA